jgi:hypothetical protein
VGVAGVGGGAVTSGTTGGVTAGALVEVRGGPAADHLGGGLALLWQTERTLILDGGAVRWRRPALLATVRWRWPLGDGRAALEIDAGAAAALLLLRGAGFARNQDVTAFDPGATASARLTARLGARAPVLPFVAAGTWLWPTAHETAVDGASGTRVVPRGDVYLAVGLALGLRP